MPVTLSEVVTIADAYETGKLKASRTEPFYPHDPALNSRVSLYRGDMTRLAVDAIVNAANRSLLGGGGVDGVIHRAAGPGLLRECQTLKGCATGSAKITKGYDLPAEHVIHAVGPMYDYDEVDECETALIGCYQTSLGLCLEHKLESVAFSGISTGIYGYPIDDATHVALRTTHNFLASEAGKAINRVIFTVFRQIDVDSYEKILPLYFPPAPSDVRSPVTKPDAIVPKPATETATSAPADLARKPAVEEDREEDEAQPMSQVEETGATTPRPAAAEDEDEGQPMSQVIYDGPEKA